MAFSMAPTETFAAANTEENGRAEGRVSDAEDTLSDRKNRTVWSQAQKNGIPVSRLLFPEVL